MSCTMVKHSFKLYSNYCLERRVVMQKLYIDGTIVIELQRLTVGKKDNGGKRSNGGKEKDIHRIRLTALLVCTIDFIASC